MTDTGIHPALNDTGLHDYIDEQARRHCRRSRENWEDARQEAWLWVSLCYDDADQDTYKRVAYNAIKNFHNYLIREEYVAFEDYYNDILS
jgi:hypothetical protein